MCPDTDPEAGKGSRQYREDRVDAGGIIQVKSGAGRAPRGLFWGHFSKIEKCDFCNFFGNFSCPLLKKKVDTRAKKVDTRTKKVDTRAL